MYFLASACNDWVPSFQTVPFYFISSFFFFFFLHSIKMPQRPLGRPVMTFPDRLPYGESNVPDAFRVPGFQKHSYQPPGARKGVPHTRCTTWLMSSLTSKLLKASNSPGAPRGRCATSAGEVTSSSRMSRWRIGREGEHLCGKADLSLTT